MKIDSRTKLFYAVAANSMILTAPLEFSLAMVVVPSILLLLEKKVKLVCAFFAVYFVSGFYFDYLKSLNFGTVGTIVVATVFLFYRALPAFVVLYYIATTPKVDEFIAAMGKMHVSNKVTIPLTVMIRFFPTVFDESRSISHAMKMRRIRLFSLRTLRNPFAILEYRLIPLLVSLTKIGDELSIAASTRGLSPDAKRTCVVPVGFHVQDYIVMVYCVAVVAVFAVRSAIP